MQLGFHPDYPDVSTLATTYNDGIYYVASFLQRELPDAIVDVCQMYWGEDPLRLSLERYNYILVSALATQFRSNIPTVEAIALTRKRGCKVIFGGPHATFAPHEVLRYADFAVLGEGELPALKLISVCEEGGGFDDIPNLCYLDFEGRMVLHRIERFPSLENPINPRFLAQAPRLHWATVSMSRGCPFDCSFCYAIRLLGRRFRTKDPAAILAELDGIHARTGCRRFYVTDLNFTTRSDFCLAVADAVRPRGYRFIAMSRIEIADDLHLVRELRRSGFTEYCLGVESEDPGVLTAFNKRVEASRQTERLQRLAEEDIYTHSAIIFGLEAQDRAAIEHTARWCAEARIVHPTFVCLAEYPFQNLLFGSKQDVEDHRILLDTHTYQHYSFVGIFPRHMRPSQLQRAILKSYDDFFQRAFEIEVRPQRRMRLESYRRSIQHSRAGMDRHTQFLEEIERPYYTPSDSLKEDLLRSAFEERYGALRAQLARAVRPAPLFKELGV